MPRRRTAAATAAFLVCLLPAVANAQTAGPYPSLVYTYVAGTGSVDPSVVQAVSSGNAPGQAILASQGSDSLTAPAPTFQTTATIGPTGPSGVVTSFTFTSGSPGEVLSSNTRPPYTASGTIDLATTSYSGNPTASTGAAAAGLSRPDWSAWKGVWGMAVAAAAGIVTGAVML